MRASDADHSTAVLTAEAPAAGRDGPAAKVRVRYAKTGRLRFISAIDLGRIWERALRKADLPIAYSEGFSPHPKVSFPDALPLGYASTGEYAELTFAGPIAVDAAMRDLNAAFVDGCEVLDALGVADGAPRLAKWLRASLWQVDYPEAVDEQRLAEAASRLLAAERLPVARERKGETAEVDLRPALHDLNIDGTRVRVVLHHGEPPLRPSEVHAALADAVAAARAQGDPALVEAAAVDRPEAADPGALPEPTLVTRVAQGDAAAGGVLEALSGDLVALRATPHDSERTRVDRSRRR